MASILKVDTIQDQSGNNIINESGDTITIGASGDTITVPTGASLTVPSGGLTGQNYPAFEATLSANQSNADLTTSKVLCDTVVFDTGSYYDNATNYRFTPLVAGKYFVYAQCTFDSTATNVKNIANYIYKNGVIYSLGAVNFDANYGEGATCNTSAVIDMNGSTDYLELFAFTDFQSGSINIQGNGSYSLSHFGAFRIGA